MSRLLPALAIVAALVAGPWGLGGAGEAVAGGVRNPDGVAVIIGNKGYHHVGEVRYAHRDAEAFRHYVLDVLGFDEENLIDLRDATQAEMVGVFGTAQDYEGKLASWLHWDGVSDVVVFYSGHGMPGLDEDDRGAYLLPADANPNKPELNGYSVDVLTRNLGKLAARSVAVYLDACFSGTGGDGQALLKASPIVPEASLPEDVGANTTVFTATSGKQLAYWDEEAGHGMFTHHLLNALYGGADADGDGRVTVAETERHLARHLRRAVRRAYHREQTAELRDGTGTGAAVLASASVGGAFPVRPVLGGEDGGTVAGGGSDEAGTSPSDAMAALRAVQDGDLEALRVAIAGGADVNARDKAGWTPLMSAANEGYVLMVPVLLEVGADPDLRAVDGATALLLASQQGYVEIVRQLLRAGADVSITNPRGNTAQEEAQARGHLKVVAAFEAVRQEEEERKEAEARGAEQARRQAEAERQERERVEAERRREAAREEEQALRLTRAERARVQVGLSELGHDVGLADGVFGSRTRAGIEAYQRGKGLPETGHLTRAQAEALVALGEEAERKAEAEAKRRKVGEVFRDCAECPQMVVVPAGSYRMGSPTHEEGRFDREGPVHEVRIPEPFAVGVYEVTRGQWSAFVEETGYSAESPCWTVEGDKWKEKSESREDWRHPGFSQGDAHPVVCVSWGDAQSYVKWLSVKTEEEYRLLSESEWEYVARAGTSTSSYWGDGERGQCRHANGADRAAKRRYSDWKAASCDDGSVYTAAVGSYEENGYGLHDVLGNVAEWTSDCWNESYAGAPRDGSAWGRGVCSSRVVRGGNWSYKSQSLRSANRWKFPIGLRNNRLGFRIARTLTL